MLRILLNIHGSRKWFNSKMWSFIWRWIPSWIYSEHWISVTRSVSGGPKHDFDRVIFYQFHGSRSFSSASNINREFYRKATQKRRRSPRSIHKFSRWIYIYKFIRKCSVDERPRGFGLCCKIHNNNNNKSNKLMHSGARLSAHFGGGAAHFGALSLPLLGGNATAKIIIQNYSSSDREIFIF